MNIADRLKLIKAGYTAKEIKEMELSEQTEEQETEQKTGPEAEQTEEKETEPEAEQTEEKETEPEPDYKALWEKTQKDLELTRKALNNKDLSKENEQKDALELVAEFFRS